MQAAAMDHAGGPEVVTLHTLPVPQPATDEVLIAVHTAGVGIWDTGLRRHPEEITHSKMPLVLGTDGAGTVVAVGTSVARFKVGDKVYAYSWDNPQGGFYAEYVAVPAERVGPVPKNLDLTQAGAIATTGLTALQGVDDALHVQRGQTLLVHGAAGGVGTLSVQFAKARGARVLATASGEDELALVRELGADAVVDGRAGDILAAARQFAPQGVDAVLAFAGGESFERCLDALRPGGRAAYPRGVHPPQPRAGLTVIDYDAVPGPKEYAQLNAAIEAQPLRVPIAAQFALADAAKAHERIEAGHVLGKIVIHIH
ncbi:MAG: NADP-dependent oxidoreductase [Gammaproteobacteria bacterium]|nr:NADP-dependent oxidoreductase [Gammaproteobacteria bacterium]